MSALRDFCLRLPLALEGRYRAVEFSADEAVEKFRPLLEGGAAGALKRKYSFRVRGEGGEESWAVIFYHTRIGHFDFGVAGREAPAGHADAETARLLVERRLADVAICQRPRGKKNDPPAGGGGPQLSGEAAGLYLRSKIDAIPSLHRMFRWEPSRPGEPGFARVADAIKSVLRDPTSGAVTTLPLDDFEPLQRLVADCDAKLLSAMSEEGLNSLLAAVSLSAREWLAAEI